MRLSSSSAHLQRRVVQDAQLYVASSNQIAVSGLPSAAGPEAPHCLLLPPVPTHHSGTGHATVTGGSAVDTFWLKPLQSGTIWSFCWWSLAKIHAGPIVFAFLIFWSPGSTKVAALVLKIPVLALRRSCWPLGDPL